MKNKNKPKNMNDFISKQIFQGVIDQAIHDVNVG